MKVVRTKEYRIPICEFGKMFGIGEDIENIYYYKGKKSLKEIGDDEDDYVTVEVSEDVA